MAPKFCWHGGTCTGTVFERLCARSRSRATAAPSTGGSIGPRTTCTSRASAPSTTPTAHVLRENDGHAAQLSDAAAGTVGAEKSEHARDPL